MAEVDVEEQPMDFSASQVQDAEAKAKEAYLGQLEWLIKLLKSN